MKLNLKYFKLSDFACKGDHCCNHSSPISIELLHKVDALRESWAEPLLINSGFRCNMHNSYIKGSAKESMHTLGLACDVAPVSRLHSFKEFIRDTYLPFLGVSLNNKSFSGIGFYKTFVHLDVRNSYGFLPATWNREG